MVVSVISSFNQHVWWFILETPIPSAYNDKKVMKIHVTFLKSLYCSIINNTINVRGRMHRELFCEMFHGDPKGSVESIFMNSMAILWQTWRIIVNVLEKKISTLACF